MFRTILTVCLFFANFALFLVASQSANNNSLVFYIVVLKDEAESNNTALAISDEEARDIFRQAVSVENRRKTRIRDYPGYSITFHANSISATQVLQEVDIRPLFLHPEGFEDMYEKIVRHENVAAVLEVETCSPKRCRNLLKLEELLKQTAQKIAIFSSCCFDSHVGDDLAAHRSPGLIYESFEPHGIVYLIFDLARRYNWRRFHFLVSPKWPTFDHLYEVFRTQLAEDMVDFEKELIVTESYFCTAYLAKGYLCSSNQAKELVLTTATAFFILLEPENDLPNFIRQINEIDFSTLKDGKAFFLIHKTGVISPIIDTLLEHAPDGLMIIRQKRLEFKEFESRQFAGLPSLGFDALLYAELRMLAKAVEIFEQIPGEYHRPSAMYCGTIFEFDDSEDRIGYENHCDRELVVNEVFNVKRSSGSKAEEGFVKLQRVYEVRDKKLIAIGSSRWIGSGSALPVEDFCKLDGAGCPDPPPPIAAIVASLVVGFVVVVLATTFLLLRWQQRRIVRKKKEDVVRGLVFVNFRDIDFENDVDFKQLLQGPSLGQRINSDLPKFGYDIITTAKAKLNAKQVFVSLLKGPIICPTSTEFIRELMEIQGLNHPNINKFLGITVNFNCRCFMQQYCSLGTLAHVLASPTYKLDKFFKLSFAIDIASGMTYLHQSPLRSHGHLSSHCIFLDSRWICKIGNLPSQTLLKFSSDSASINNSNANSRRDSKTSVWKMKQQFTRRSSSCVSEDVFADGPDDPVRNIKDRITFFWTAPELLRLTDNHSPLGTQPGDVYSFAVVLFEILTQEKPFASSKLHEKGIFSKLTKEKTFRPEFPAEVPDGLYKLADLARECWHFEPDKRPKFPEVTTTIKGLNNEREITLVDQLTTMLQNDIEELEKKKAVNAKELERERKQTELIRNSRLPRFVVEGWGGINHYEPKRYENVTVLVAGFADFGKFIKQFELSKVPEVYNKLFKRLETASAPYDCHRIELNSSLFMVASGLPNEHPVRHVSQIAKLAIDLVKTVESYSEQFETKPQLRCGINTGPVVGGVIGASSNAPRYCLLGKTVDLARRLERMAPLMTVHISSQTNAIIEATKKFETIVNKSEGAEETYFLIKKASSED